VDDLSPEDYFLDWDRLFLGRGVDLVGERLPVVAIHARELINKFTEGSNFRNSEPIQNADTREREALSVQYREVAEIRNNRRAIEVNQFMICLRAKNDAALQGEGFTPEEESLPFYLAKATSAVPEDCPADTRIDICTGGRRMVIPTRRSLRVSTTTKWLLLREEAT
jgi:hypothetical protein